MTTASQARPILVVDDDAGIRETITTILEDEGYRVVQARDGLEALDQVAATQPALILLDIGMPRLDGFGFAEELGRRGLRAGRAVLVLTANNRAQASAAHIGADGYIEKPFSLDTLIDRVHTHFAA
jgi:two-component system, OmpR family, response regulator MprA